MTITTRKPTAEDVPALSRLVYDAFESIAKKHNFPLDFPSPDAAHPLMEAWVHNPKVFGVVAIGEGKIVGCNFLEQRNPIAGVGPVCVDPKHQGKGIGKRLMEEVLIAGRQARGIRLVQDAFNTTSMSLYTSLGFEVREPLALMIGRIKSAGPSRDVRAMTKDDLPACAALCEKVHGHHRTGELTDALAMLHPHVLERGGRIVAYASAPWMWFLNHGVAENEADLRDLLSGACASSKESLQLLVPTRQTSLFRWMLGEGVRFVKPMSLMTMGYFQPPTSTYYPSVLY